VAGWFRRAVLWVFVLRVLLLFSCVHVCVYVFVLVFVLVFVGRVLQKKKKEGMIPH
jgi:hypothetical protein